MNASSRALAAALALVAAPVVAQPDAARGPALARHYACAACHRIPGLAGPSAQLGPPLDGFGVRSYIAGHLPNRPDTLARWIADPNALVPGTLMPDVGVTPADARDLAAWLESMQP